MQPKPAYRLGYNRANRAGLMLLIITLCQYGVPLLFLGILRLFDVDTAADSWGFPSTTYLFLYLLMYLGMTGLPLWLCARCLSPKTDMHPSELMLSHDRRICVVLLCVALCVLSNILATFFSGLLYQAGVPQPRMLRLGDGSIVTLLLDLLVFAVIPAFMEEHLMRGIVLQTLRPLGGGAAVSVSALLFGLMHGNVAQTPYAILMGVVLGILYVCTDDLRLCIVAHALANGVSVIVSFLIHYCSAQTAALWETVILIVVLMMGGVSALWLWRHPLGRSKRHLPVPLRLRLSALFRAPLLWAAVLLLTVIVIVSAL